MENDSDNPPERMREVRYRHSPSFVDVLRGIGSSLLVSTYQAGKLVTIGVHDHQLQFAFHQFDQAMGVAVSPRQIAVGAKGQVWFLQDNSQIAPSLAPPGRYDACYLARTARVTGSIHCHEINWAGDELWVVNTLFSCLSTLHDDFNFVPRWQPPFITELIGQDRCHLNGMAMHEGQPRFVTVMAESNEPAGWRPTKSSSGCVLEVASGQPVTRGLSMPHSPRWYEDRLWVLNSGYGSLEATHLPNGQRDVVARMPGYARGLAFHGPLAFVGLSRIRETAVFGGVPIAEHRAELKCGVGVIDIRSGQTVATLEFQSGVEEIFDVQIIPGARCTYLCGPRPDQDGAQDIWIVPRPDQVKAVLARRAGPVTSSGPPSFSPRDSSHSGPVAASSTDQASALVHRGLELQSARRIGEALELFRQAAQLVPTSAEILNHWGNALQDADRQVEAIELYRRAVAVDPGFAPALQNLGYTLVSQGFTEEGLTHLEKAQQVKPAPVNRVMIATTLPIIYKSMDDLRRWRTRITSEVQGLVDDHLTLDTSHMLIPTNFFAVYQGENDRELHGHLGQIYQGLDASRGRTIRPRQVRRRIGFLSAYFRDHTIGRLNLGRIQKLDRADWEVFVLSVGKHDDEMAQRFMEAGDRYVALPRDVSVARQAIADTELDLLFFSDVGMDALTYSLAFSRMAPVQCVTWGHPVTTGSATMDYFLSSEQLETGPASQEHYTEELVRRPTLGTYYYRPPVTGPPKSRSDFGLPLDRTLYVCPQTLFKFHPEFDALLAGILRQDPRAHLALIEGRVPQWTRLLRERFQMVMPDVLPQIQFLPPQPNADFLQLLANADVILDPIHFGGGNTSYESLAMGTPLVTWPGTYLRSRITFALYAKMDMMDLVAKSLEEYVKLALKLGTNAEFRENMRRTIQGKCHVLFEDEQEVRDLEQFFHQVLA